MSVNTAKTINEIKAAAAQMRRDAINMTQNAGNSGAHIGGTLSMIEIMATLYLGIMCYDGDNPGWERRDRFILSKGHGAMAQYAAMKQAGILSAADLLTYKKNESRLNAHPSLGTIPGIEFSSGSLGQGLSLGVGVALALRRKANKVSRVFVLVGDGECDEGSIWEAASSASHYRLNNLVAIIDENRLQYDGRTDEIQNKQPFAERWSSFGWETRRIDGHSIEQLLDALNTETKRPLAVIARTIKGKGITFMENDPLWHNRRLTETQYQTAIEELERA